MTDDVGAVGGRGMEIAAEDLPKEKKGLLAVGLERHAKLAALMGQGAAGLADADVVHDVRVATRRLGEVARMIAEAKWVDKATGRAVEESLKKMRRAMGEMRDGDVAREHLEKWKMPAAVKRVAHGVAEEVLAKRAGLMERAGELIASASVQGAMVVLARVLEEKQLPGNRKEAEGMVEESVQELIKRREKQLRRAFGKAAMKQTAESLHAARIAVKKLRYALELAEAGGMEGLGGKNGKGTKGRLKFLKKMQGLLGEHHDVHVVEEMVEGRILQEPGKGARKAWQAWKRKREEEQTRRVVEFLMRAHEWMNA